MDRHVSSSQRQRAVRAIALLLLCLLTSSPVAAGLIPRADDAYWRDSIPASMRQDYIRYGEQYLGRPWTVLPWTAFAQFKTNGNRVGYEAVCFEKRRHLAALVMAEIMEGENRFLNDIIDGMGSFCEETWWGIPAHYGKRIPLADQQEVDLFNAETASLVAWTAYMLHPQLQQFAPELCQRIDREVARRLLEPALKKDYWWKKAGMNWNPWIGSNWLTCLLLCEHDDARRQAGLAQILKSMEAFVDAYPDDGGCDEGAGYWDRAAASLYEELNLLRMAGLEAQLHPLQGKEQKVARMGSYVYKTYIGNDYCVDFADAHENRAVQQVNVVYPFGLYLGDRTMCEFAAYLGRQKQIVSHPAALYDKSGNFPTLGRELIFLSHIGQFLREQPREPLLSDVWLPDLQIMTARRGPLYVAMKGGHNDESHNHNDLGSFIVYADGQPLLIDVGVGEYTSKTFSKERYTIWTMQSQYHNLPQINGCDQQAGRAFAARVVDHKAGRLSLELAGAYPAEAAVKSWKRTVSTMKSAITVSEDYELFEHRAPTRLYFMTTQKPQTGPGVVAIGTRRLLFEPAQLDAAVEDLSQLLDPVLQHMWGSALYRIVLTVKPTKTKNHIKYTIQ